MEKSRFIEVAPYYYALAIISYFRRNGEQTVSRVAIQADYVDGDGDPYEGNPLLGSDVIFDRAIALLVDADMLALSADDFGPPIFIPTSRFEVAQSQWRQRADLPFGRYEALNGRDREIWLRSALSSLGRSYVQLAIGDGDFERPDDEWRPLPIERSDPDVQQAIASIDETIEMVRADNGYSATVPEERAYVLDGLSNTSRTLKEEQSVSARYIREHALEPLKILGRRFRETAIAIVVEAARKAVIEFLTKHGVRLLEYFLFPPHSS